MQMITYLRNKISRQLQMNGQKYVFKHLKEDEFHQVSDEVEKEIEVVGLFHTTNSYIKNSDSDGTRITSKLQPMLLVLYEDGMALSKDDKVMIGSQDYKITKKNDINNFGVAFDISLEEVLK